MKQIRPIATAALCALAMFSGAAFASSHREAPAISFDPAADNTDLWAWVKPGTHDRLYIVASYNPLEEPAGGPNFHKFSDEVLYEVHISRGDNLADLVTYQFRFKTNAAAEIDPANLAIGLGGGKEFFAQLAAQGGGGFQQQLMTVTKVQGGRSRVIARNVRVMPPNIGPRTFATVTKGQFATSQTDYNDAFTQEFVTNMGTNGAEGTVWAGPRDDGFYVDLGGVFDLATLTGLGRTNPTDGVAGYNCHTIALDLPTSLFTVNGGAPGSIPGNDTTLGVWASASRRKVSVLHQAGDETSYGPWVQVSRLGLPLINEAVIGIQDKDKYNRTQPWTDADNFASYFLNPVIVRDAEFLQVYGAGVQGPRENRTDILDAIGLTNIPSAGAHSFQNVGDVLRVDMAVDSSFPNGRPIAGGTNVEQADVTDVLLSLLLTKNLSGVSDGVNHNDKVFLDRSPWLALPWRGLDEGHGRAAQ
jgi:hypothetical protein